MYVEHADDGDTPLASTISPICFGPEDNAESMHSYFSVLRTLIISLCIGPL